MLQHTIFALATAPVKSGVAIIRLSGPTALDALKRLTGKPGWQPNIARYVTFSLAIRHSPLATIDSGLALFFQAPHSFTGEDVVELHLHGSIAVIREMQEVLAGMGLRPAEPGEFSRRAFMNGKMDLIEAEGLADLIDAESPRQKAQALGQLGGAMSRYYSELRERIIKVLAHLEAYIDFPEEDIPESVVANLKGDIAGIIALIDAALADNRRGERIRQGIRIVILGAPNAGKSSLLNALSGRDAAIVSERAGTTRDVIEVHMDIAGFPVILTDTAGLRNATDDIEEEGVRRAHSRAEQADLKLILFDAALEPDKESLALVDDNSLVISNKIDLSPLPRAGEGSLAGALQARRRAGEGTFLSISTKTGEGLEALLTAVERHIASTFSSASAPLITRARHRETLKQALSHLQRIDFSAPLELTCEELRQAAVSIGKITGKIALDEVLNVVFRSFCIGK